MTSIRRTGTALALAVAFSLPTLASAEQATQLCDGSKAEHKEQPTADRSKQNTSSEPKTDDKANQKPDENKKPDSTQTGKTS
ncbi:MAG TPA: hypothetical protein VJV78_36820 [Polyangiales bacterium]|nr:hypothetical protein [Polyangiales bacterium]